MKKRLLSMLLICSSAPAHSLTGNEWLALWQGDDYDKFQAAGYLAGAWETQSFFGTGGKCHDEPIGVTLGQYRKVVIKFMESNPSDTHLPMPVISSMAAIEAWGVKDIKKTVTVINRKPRLHTVGLSAGS